MTNYIPQPDLFGSTNKSEKFDKIHKQIDSLEEKFGKKVIYLGSTKNALDHNSDSGGTDSDDLDKDLLFL
jgi:hypothetical protein